MPPDGGLTVGVLGGMGPEATIDFMATVLRLTGAGRDQDHVHLIVDQNPGVPNRQQAIRGEGPDAAPALAAMARRLELAGADFLVMPCNSAHAFVPAIRGASRVPFVSIVDACLDDIRATLATGHSVGILATDGLVETGIYQDAVTAAAFRPLLPSAEEQRQLMDLIRRIKAGEKDADVAGTMLELANALIADGAACILAACTEIPLVLRAGSLSVPLVSSTESLARRTVALARRAMPLPATAN